MPAAVAWCGDDFIHRGGNPWRTSIRRLLARCFGLVAVVAAGAGRADAAVDGRGREELQALSVEHIGEALAGAKELQAAVKAGDVKAAQAAWIASRKGWEAIEPITGELFPDSTKRSMLGRMPSTAITPSRRRCLPASR